MNYVVGPHARAECIGCARTTAIRVGRHPRAMSAARREAVQLRSTTILAKQAGQYAPNSSTAPALCKPKQACWTGRVNPTRQQRADPSTHRELAAKHRAAAQASRDAVAGARVEIEVEDRVARVGPGHDLRRPSTFGRHGPAKRAARADVTRARACVRSSRLNAQAQAVGLFYELWMATRWRASSTPRLRCSGACGRPVGPRAWVPPIAIAGIGHGDQSDRSDAGRSGFSADPSARSPAVLGPRQSRRRRHRYRRRLAARCQARWCRSWPGRLSWSELRRDGVRGWRCEPP